MILQIENLCFRYKSIGAAERMVLRDINLRIEEGEFLAIVGASGSGKTTLMQHLTGLLKPDSGRILIDGEDLWKAPKNLTQIRRRIGLVFQFPETQLFEETVFEDVAFGPKNLGLRDSELESRVSQALQAVGINFERFRGRVPFHLSEGEKRRVAIAGTLAMQPECLVLDEPTAGLDPSGIQAMIETLQAFHSAVKTVLLISHNLDLVASLVTRVIVLGEGQVRFDGSTAELFRNLTWLRTAGLSFPRILAVTAVLKQMGLLQSTDIFSVEELKRVLAASLRQTRMRLKS
ncbi:ATP-binding cassette domain-containing protein [bacterium]|nr:ATP-binding cassette domain-containing protein [bacterium]